MILRLYQLDIENPKSHGLIFRDWDRIQEQFDFNNYHMVYENQNFNHYNSITGELVLENTESLLDHIFSLFNIGRKPENYHGHSLSVSDIIELNGIRYYIDGIGFKQL